VTYIVTCTLCRFQREIDELEDVLDFQDAHRANCGDEHTIEFERLEQNERAND
jgi:hypothetical protein